MQAEVLECAGCDSSAACNMPEQACSGAAAGLCSYTMCRLSPFLPAGVGLSHLSGEVKRLMSTLTKYDQDNYPEMLGRICIINAPMVFKAIWQLVKPLLNPRTLSKIQVCEGQPTHAVQGL